MNKTTYRAGISAISAIIFIAVLVALAILVAGLTGRLGVGTVGFFGQDATLDEVVDAIVEDLQDIKAKSRDEANNLWGLCFRNPVGGDFYVKTSGIVFPDAACTISDSVQEEKTQNLPDRMFFINPVEGGTESVVFRSNGSVIAASDIVISIGDGENSRIITVTPSGEIMKTIPGVGVVEVIPPPPVPPTTVVSPQITTTVSQPSAPRFLTVTGFSNNIRLDWSPSASAGSSPIISYVILRGTSPGTGTALTTVAGSLNTYTDFNVVQGVIYYYTVRATNAVGSGPASNEVAASTVAVTTAVPSTADAQAPSAPNLSVFTDDDGIELSWSRGSQGSSAIIEYQIYRGLCNGCEAFYRTVSGSRRNFTDSNVSDGITYYYKIRARNSQATSGFSNLVAATFFEDTVQDPIVRAPAAPSLSASGEQNRIALAWGQGSQGSSTVLEFQIYRGICNGCEIFLTSVPGNSSAYNDSAVDRGVTYYYKIRARNSQATSGFSNTVSAALAPAAQQPPAQQPPAEQPPAQQPPAQQPPAQQPPVEQPPAQQPPATVQIPGEPSGVSTSSTSSSVTLTWNPPTTGGVPTEYQIFKLYSGSYKWVATILAQNQRTYTNSGLSSNTTYNYQIFAKNSAGESPRVSVSATTLAPQVSVQVPGAPTNIQTTSTSGSIRVLWDPPISGGAPDEYLIYKLKDGSYKWVATILASNPRVYENLCSGTCQYQISAKNSAGESQRVNFSGTTK
ncbi:MAG: fibronectin type III domain-containing protein [Candidatus Colwellbacteria bacterium]|nr:fibronectin type III domain-containing protein [Candidatus Colwellbacteria bacterium]